MCLICPYEWNSVFLLHWQFCVNKAVGCENWMKCLEQLASWAREEIP
jgi:hypothetical protein